MVKEVLKQVTVAGSRNYFKSLMEVEAKIILDLAANNMDSYFEDKFEIDI